MTDTKYNLGEMLERRIRIDAEPTVRAMRESMEGSLEALVSALGIDHHSVNIFGFVNGVAHSYREKLVRDALSAAVDGMINGKPVKQDAAPVSAPAPAPALDFYLGQEFGAALCDHFGLPGNQVAAGMHVETGCDEALSATLTIFLKPNDLSGIAAKMAAPSKS